MKVPKAATHNPFGGAQHGGSYGLYMHQFPLLFTHRIGRYNIKEIDTVRHRYLMSFQLDAVGGGGLNRMINNIDEGTLNLGGLYDTVEFRQTQVRRRRSGGFLMGGVTARFYRLGKERLTLNMYYAQGLTNMLLVPIDYRYNIPPRLDNPTCVGFRVQYHTRGAFAARHIQQEALASLLTIRIWLILCHW